jgi:hypothetical protein
LTKRAVNRLTVFAAFLSLLGLLALPSFARAQRAEHYGSQEAPRTRSATRDYPGLFDTNMAAPGTVVGNLPWLSLYWGVSERLTLGTNVLYAVPLLFGSPGGLLSARYRFYSTGAVQTVLDAIAGGFRIHDTDTNERTSHSVILSAVHTTVTLSGAHELTFSVLGGNLDVAVDTKREDDDVALTGVGVGAGYAWLRSRWFSLRGYVLLTPIVTGVIDTRSARVEADLAESSGIFERLLYRGYASFRAGGHWLFEAGVVGAGVHVSPWFDIYFRIG